MWFLFGFISLIGFTYIAYRQRINTSWTGDPLSANGVSFQYKVTKGRFYRKHLLVSIKAPLGYDYTLKKETKVDRFFKLIGLSNEYQIGHEQFDDLIYIVSEKQQLHRQLTSNSVVRDSAIQIFSIAESYNCKVIDICHNSGRLWVNYRAQKGFNQDIATLQATEAAVQLKAIADAMEDIPTIPSKGWKDPFVIKSAIILTISSSMLIYSFMQFIWLRALILPDIIDNKQLLYHSVLAGIAVIALLVIAAIIILDRSSRTHIVLLELVIVGIWGAVMTSYATLRSINIEFDNSPYVQQLERVNYKSQSREGRRSSYDYDYYLHLTDWLDEDSIKIEVNKPLYNSVTRGDHVIIHYHEGFLGYRWVANVKKKQ